MNYSDLSMEDRKSMLELTENLVSYAKEKEELLEKLSPLKDELSKLKKEISEQNEKAQNLFSYIAGENRTVENTIEYNETLIKIDELETKYRNVEKDILQLKNDINPVLAAENEIIEKMNDLRIKNNGKLEINEDGVVVIKEINASKFNKEIKINQTKNVIIQTKKNVSNFIKDKYEKAKNTSIKLGKTLVQKLNNFYEKNIKANIEEITKEFMEGYNSVRNENISDEIDAILEKRKKTEEEADNIEFVDNIEKKEEKKQNEKLQIEDKESKEEGFIFVEEPEEKKVLAELEEANEVLSKDNLEVKNAKFVEAKVVEDNKVEEKEDNNIFVSTPIKENASNEAEQVISEKEEIKPFSAVDHFVNMNKNKIAKTTKTKLNKMIETFIELPNYIGKFVANVKNEMDLQNYKKEKIAEITNRHNEEERKVLEENKEKLQKLANEYNNELENFENIFGKTMAA